MPLPFIIAGGAFAAATIGATSGVKGAKKRKEANDTMKSASSRHQSNINKFERQNKTTSNNMDDVGKKELEILKSFESFTEVFEKIHSKPEFKTYNKDDISIPRYNKEELKKVSIGAGVLLSGLAGAAVGTAGAFAASGATTAAVMALGTASTGTAIATLTGVAATNATLAVLGGGTIVAGGGGMALGTTVLGAATLGVGLLVGGVIFNIAGSTLSNKADEAWSQMEKAQRKINKICTYLNDLSIASHRFKKALNSVDKAYRHHLDILISIVETNKKTDWNTFTPEEKLIAENTALLVNLLYNICKVKLVLESKDVNGHNNVNTEEINKSIKNAEACLNEKGLQEYI